MSYGIYRHEHPIFGPIVLLIDNEEVSVEPHNQSNDEKANHNNSQYKKTNFETPNETRDRSKNIERSVGKEGREMQGSKYFFRSSEKKSSGVYEEINRQKKPLVPIDKRKSQQHLL